ncbi:MAG: hypothetical protein ABEK00_00475 [Candidatus Nanohaloarchaea archaeon]
MEKKQKLLSDPGISTFYRTALKKSPETLEKICGAIGVKRNRARKWVRELEQEGLLSVERKNGKTVVTVTDSDIDSLKTFSSRLQEDFSSELRKWDERLRKAANEIVRVKDVSKDEEHVKDLNKRLDELKKSEQKIDLTSLKALSDVESFLGYSEIAREEMHQFHRKFKVLEKLEGL